MRRSYLLVFVLVLVLLVSKAIRKMYADAPPPPQPTFKAMVIDTSLQITSIGDTLYRLVVVGLLPYVDKDRGPWEVTANRDAFRRLTHLKYIDCIRQGWPYSTVALAPRMPLSDESTSSIGQTEGP